MTRGIVDKMHWTRACFGAGLLALGLMVGPFMTQGAFAGIGGCGTDPMVTLSDGSVIDLITQMSTIPSNVASIMYTVHVPVGTTVTAVYYTGGPFTRHENVQVFADNAAGTYDTDTFVTAVGTGFAVTATSTAIAPSGLLLGPATALGSNGQDLRAHLAAPSQ